MESTQGCGSSLDFGFGFNDEKFSDRIISLQLIPNSNGQGEVHTSENPSCMDTSFPTKTKTIHISTIILAARSRFFYKLFSNGMVESNQHVIILPIQESAEAAIMDLFKYMYTNTLSSTTPCALVDVLIAADKYEVESCMKYCFHLLKELPMTCESALLYLDLPSTVLMADTTLSLTYAAKEFLIARFKDISKSKEEMLKLPLAGIKVVLSSDNLQVDSEDDIYEFVMNWARRHYTKRGERRKMLTKHLLCLIRFPFMSRGALEEVLTCKDITLEQRSKLVFEAISQETRHRQLPPVKEQERLYNFRPVKVTRFDSPHEACKVYLDLNYEECARLLPSAEIYSQNFYLAGEEFYLVVEHYVDEQSSAHSFGFYLGQGEVHTSENPSCMDTSFPTKTKTIHISTIILAARSRFFYKLFSNGMVESNQHVITLPIQESAEAAVMDLLKYMYTNTLSSATPFDLVDVLCVADKYEVESCMNYCFQLLKESPMTCESALLYLDLPSTVLMADTTLSLTYAAKEFLIARFKDISKSEEEMLNLPLAGIKVVLSSDDLQLYSEDQIYDFVMNWARQHYTKRGERRKMLTKHLLCLIRFPFMSRRKLEEVLTCKDIILEQRSKLVFEAISLETPHRQLPPVKEQERVYKLRPVKVSRFGPPYEACQVYLDLKYEECARLLPSDEIYSQEFYLAGEEFFLFAERHVDEHNSAHGFGFFLGMRDYVSLGVEYNFSWRMKPNEEVFVGKYKYEYNFAEAESHGCPNLFEVPWDTFIAESSPYFINGVLHLRAVIQIKK